MKQCRKCGEIKTIESFHPRKDSPDGRRSDCIMCKKAQDAARHLANMGREELLSREVFITPQPNWPAFATGIQLSVVV